MLKRNNIDFPVIWIHANISRPQAANYLEMARVKHEEEGDFTLSVNTHRNGNEALIKVAGVDPTWVEAIADSQYVNAVYDHTNHADALALVTTPEWLPLPE